MTAVVAVCNFGPPFPDLPTTPSTSSASTPLAFLPFFIGERLRILSRCQEWCYGSRESVPQQSGLFPAVFVEPVEETTTGDDDFQRRASNSVFYGAEESKQLLLEITEALKSWWRFMKARYARGIAESDFRRYVSLVNELMLIRKKILSGNVPTEELRELRHSSARKIDLGNHLMELGMHIRDEASRILRIDNLSVVEAYREHERAFAKITNESPEREASVSALIVTLNQTDFRLGFDCDVSLMLFNSEKKSAVTEPLTFQWSRDKGKFNHKSLSAMFTDLTEKELADDRLELAATVTVRAPIDVTLAAMAGKALKSESLNSAFERNCRQPLATARIGLAEKLRDIVDKEKRELRLSLTPLLPLEKYQSASRKSDLCIDFTIQRLTASRAADIRERHPEVFSSTPPICIRKLHPENARAVLEEMRNEVYLRLCGADLHGFKHSDKNVEAVLRVFDDEGTPQPGCFETVTPDAYLKSDVHRSLVFCAEDRPNFDELVKILLPTHAARDLHLRVLFFHRRSIDKQDKGPFAMSYLRLFDKGVLVKSGPVAGEEMLVYKIEKYEERNVSYLRQCSTRTELKSQQRPPLRQETSSFTLTEKNSLTVDTNVLSAIHTTNPQLLLVLRFRDKQSDVVRLIDSLISREDTTDELVKFLPTFCDALFQILGNDDAGTRDVVFRALVHVIRVCEDNYRALLDDYLARFHATNAFAPLMQALVKTIDEAPKKNDEIRDLLLPVLKTLGLLTRFIIRSKECFDRIRPNADVSIADNLMVVLRRLQGLVQDDMKRMTCQNAAIQFLPTMLPPLIESGIFEPVQLAKFLVELLDGLCANITTSRKVVFLGEVVATDLFRDPECLRLLLPRFLDEVMTLMEPLRPQSSDLRPDFHVPDYVDTAGFCARVIADIVERLFPFSQLHPVYQTGVSDQLQLIVTRTLRTVDQMVISLLSGNPTRTRPVYALLLALLDKISTPVFVQYLAHLPLPQDRLDLLEEMLHMFRDLLERCPFPGEWYQMRYLQHKLFLKHLRFIKAYILRFLPHAAGEDATDAGIWLEFFKTAGSIIHSLQDTKDQLIYQNENRAMREAAAVILRSMWFSLSPEQKPKLLDRVLGDLLHVTLADDPEVRSTMIPVVYDMLLVERGEERRFVDDFIMHLDPSIDTGLGNLAFRTQLRQELSSRCGSEDLLHLEFVERIDKLLELLLNLRQVRNDADCVESGKLCLVQLVNFYDGINQNELKVHHLHNLYLAHLESGSDVEAAFTLRRFAHLLEWSNAPIPAYITKRQYDRRCKTQAALRESLFVEMASLFDKGEHWEKAIEVLKDLVPVYEHILVDYGKLADLHRRIGALFDKINSQMRTECYYFLVAFYGRGYPEYLANKKFVFRGDKLEMLGQFKERMLGKYFGAQFIDNIDNCDSLASTEGKFIQIIPVTPTKSSKAIHNPSANSMVRWYFKHHDVCEFEHLRSERRDNTKWTRLEANDATRLWVRRKVITVAHALPGILNFAPVEREEEPEAANPVEVAIQKIEEVNENLRETAELVAAGVHQYTVSLGGWIRGVLQADVGGGIKNYDTFFSDEIASEASPGELKAISRLRRLLLHHVAILEYCLCVHASRPQFVAESLHTALVELFLDYRRNIESRFGPATSRLQPGYSIHLPASGSLVAANSTSTPSFAHASTSSLSLDEASDKQNMLMRMPGAATLLRTTMSRSKLPPNTTAATPKKSLGPASTVDDAQMLQTLRELACRSIVASPEPRADGGLSDFEAAVTTAFLAHPPPLPDRCSSFHGVPIQTTTTTTTTDAADQY